MNLGARDLFMIAIGILIGVIFQTRPAHSVGCDCSPCRKERWKFGEHPGPAPVGIDEFGKVVYHHSIICTHDSDQLCAKCSPVAGGPC